MKRPITIAATTAASALLLTGLSATPADAARCVSGSEVRGQVAAFVHAQRDDVTSAKARAAVKGALVESVKAARGAKPDTPKENRGLGAEVRELAKQLKDAADKVERVALIAEIHALQEQKRAGDVTPSDEQELRAGVRKVGHAVADETDTRGEGRAVADFVHALMAQFGC